MTQRTTERRILDGSMWSDFCKALERAGDQVLRTETPADVFDRAEGYRYLTRLLRLALEKNVEFADPRFPAFYSLSHETAKIGNDNPDNHYLNCAVSGRYTYRIRGRRGTAPYLSIETKAGSYGTTGTMEPTGHIELDDLEIAPDGTFEITVSTEQASRNWLPMKPETDNLLVRQTFEDRARETPAQLTIECLDADGENVLDPASFAAALERVPAFVAGTAGLFIDWMDRFGAHVNALPMNDQAMCLRAGGDPAITYHNSVWRLADDEALVIEVDALPECRTWNFQLSNFWMESLDYRTHRISVNAHTAKLEPGGGVRIVVAHEDPGEAHPNWIQTAGHRQGAMLFRYVEAKATPPIRTRVVKHRELTS